MARLSFPTDDVVRYLNSYEESELRRIGDRAQERVLAEHTSERRAREFEACIERAREPEGSLAVI